jgi:hypothetical protein
LAASQARQIERGAKGFTYVIARPYRQWLVWGRKSLPAARAEEQKRVETGQCLVAVATSLMAQLGGPAGIDGNSDVA